MKVVQIYVNGVNNRDSVDKCGEHHTAPDYLPDSLESV